MSDEIKKILGIDSIPFIKEYINASNAQIAEMVDNELKQYVDSKVQHMENGISVFTSTIFIRTNTTPEKPVGGSYDNPLPENSSWTDSIPNGNEVLWASTRLFASDGGELQQAEWSEPAKMTDTSDFEAIYSSKENPLQPTSDDFKRNNDGSISIDWLLSNQDWTDNPTEESIWMATNTAKNGVWSTWKVSKIKGEDGIDGKDGDNIEFIYCLTRNENESPAPTEYSIEDNFVPKGWTNNPTGVDMQFKCEYFSMRKKAEGFWGNWSEPALWSKYGANGQDGDGVQYIYIKTTTNDIPANPTPENYETNTDYQSDSEWVPAYNENLEFQWTDDPQGVDNIVKYEWVASRKYRLNDDGTKKLWHPFSTPSLWSKYGEKGDPGDGSNTKIIMIYKSADSVEAPKDGDYDFDTNTFITPNGWTTNLSELCAPIWMCSRIFSSAEELTETEWSLPIKVTGEDGRPGQDGDTVEFIYYNTALNEVIAEHLPENSQEDKFIPKHWTNNPTGISLELQYEFFSSRTKHNGVWSNWSRPALWAKYGEQGPQGLPGKSGKVVYPAGKFVENKMYTSTETKTPYVIDTNDEYYVLKSENYSSSRHPKDAANDWEKFESFEALYAKIGIIENGTIGSAVYSGDFMFSQQGVNEYNEESYDYHKFDKDDPFNSFNEFIPNICINFKTGKMWVNGGKMSFSNGSVNLSGFILKNECVIPIDMLDEYFDDKYTQIENNSVKGELDVSKIGSYIFLTNPTTSNYATSESNGDISKYIYLPSNGNPYFNNLTTEEKNKYISKLRSLIGNSIYIYNNWVTPVLTTQKFNLGIGTGNQSTTLYPGQVAKCDLLFDEHSDNETYIWKITIKTSTLSNNSGIASKPIKPSYNL